MTDGVLPEYRARIASGTLNDDTGQRAAVEKLQLLHTRLRDYRPEKPKKVRLGRFGWGREKMETRTVPGLYLYGGVGRGKSMLMDMFFDNAQLTPRKRVHFHAFMQEMHVEIGRARKSGTDDPIRPVADRVADSATLLCFDEMQITDITDAMLVGRLFERLFARGVVVVATSNRHPDDLYKDGLNRHLFLPFIEMIKDRLDVHQIEGAEDHRRTRLKGREIWHTPLGPDAKAALDRIWNDLGTDAAAAYRLPRPGREILIPEFANGLARMSFSDLCETPLGPGDYLAIAQAVRVLMIEDIPALGPEDQNAAKRFVTLIDTLYEARVRLVASAATEPDRLYPAGPGSFEFARTASRIAEMRSADWA